MSKIQNQQFYVENGQFSGGTDVTGLNGDEFLSASQNNPQWGYNAGGLYIGTVGSLVVKTIDGSVLTFASASGFIPGLFSAVSGSTTAGNIIALK
jgi:hypothetical protein